MACDDRQNIETGLLPCPFSSHDIYPSCLSHCRRWHRICTAPHSIFRLDSLPYSGHGSPLKLPWRFSGELKKKEAQVTPPSRHHGSRSPPPQLSLPPPSHCGRLRGSGCTISPSQIAQPSKPLGFPSKTNTRTMAHRPREGQFGESLQPLIRRRNPRTLKRIEPLPTHPAISRVPCFWDRRKPVFADNYHLSAHNGRMNNDQSRGPLLIPLPCPRFNLSGMCPVRTTTHYPPTPPPLFSKPCR